jgi:hypothetical protein
MIRHRPSRHAPAGLKSERWKADAGLAGGVGRVLPGSSSGSSLIEHGIARGDFEGARVGLGKRQIRERYGLLALARVDACDQQIGSDGG